MAIVCDIGDEILIQRIRIMRIILYSTLLLRTLLLIEYKTLPYDRVSSLSSTNKDKRDTTRSLFQSAGPI